MQLTCYPQALLAQALARAFAISQSFGVFTSLSICVLRTSTLVFQCYQQAKDTMRCSAYIGAWLCFVSSSQPIVDSCKLFAFSNLQE